jgi:tRNA(adenine34) deaminase
MSRAPAEPAIDAVDRAMMERCIALSLRAVDLGEYPYAAVICRNGVVVCESINSARHDRDVSRHAEIVAMSEALRRLDRVSLEDCTIYANAEPCALCCYAMRETRISRRIRRASSAHWRSHTLEHPCRYQAVEYPA